MKRTLYAILLLFLSVTTLTAQTPIRQWFVTMPDSITPLLTKNDRLDFIDFIDSHMSAVVTNRLDGKSRMTQLTDDYIHIEYTPISDITMKLLPVSDTTRILCMVTTMKTAVRDSRISFYSEGWKPLRANKLFSEPRMKQFFTDEPNDSALQARQKLDIYFKTYSLSPQDNTLTCRLTTLDFLSAADREAVKPYVREELNYDWNGAKFIIRK